MINSDTTTMMTATIIGRSFSFEHIPLLGWTFRQNVIGTINPVVGMIVDPTIVKASPRELNDIETKQQKATRQKVTKKFSLVLIFTFTPCRFDISYSIEALHGK